MHASLKDRTVNGVGWSTVDAFLGQGVTFLVGIVLARLLSPSEYGLIGIVSIFTVILTGIVDSGFSNALIRKTDATEEDYSTMFLTNMVFSFILFLFLFFASPLIASFFNRSELVSVVRVMGFILIIQALSIVQNTILTKRIDFKTKTKASIISAITSGTIGIGMAFTGCGVWSLVGQLLSRQSVYTTCLWVFNKWVPKFEFHRASFLYMWNFGWKITVSGLLNNIWTQMYHLVVGKFYSPDTLGQFSRSKEYAQLFSSNFTSIVQRVTYPVLAEVQNEKERMITAYRVVIRVSVFITAILMLSMGAISEPFIYCLIGPQWHLAASYLPFICVSLSMYPLHAINLNLLQVQGRSDIFLMLEIVKKIIAVVPICLGIFVSVYWMLIASIITNIIDFFLNSHYTGKELGYSSWMQLKDVLPSYGIALIIAFSVYYLKYLPVSYWIILPLQITLGLVVFIVVCNVFRVEEYREVRAIALSFLSKFKNHL